MNYLLYIFMMMNFVNGMGATVFSGILDKVAVSLNISIASTGLLMTSYALGAAIGVPVVLFVFAKANRKKLMLVMLSLTILSTFGIIYAPNFELLLLFRILMGITGNSYGVLAISTVIAMSDRERQGRSLAFLIMGNSLALIVGVPLTRLLSAVLDWRSIFLILNALSLIGLMVLSVRLPNPKQVRLQHHLKDELKYLKSPWILGILTFTLFMFIGYSAFFTYSTPYILDRFPSLEPMMSLVLFFIGLATFIGNYLGGKLSDHLGYARTLWLGAGLQVLSILLLILFQSTLWATVFFIIAFMMSAWLTGLNLNVGIMKESHHEASFILSLNGTGIQLGSALGSSIAAMIITQTHLSSILWITLIATTLIFILQSVVLKTRPQV